MSKEYSTNSSEQEREKAISYLDSLADKTIDHDVVIERYDTSSDIYEKNMAVLNYGGPMQTGASLSKLYPNNREDVHILDVGAGTGLCAIELRKQGFKKIDAFDASQPMLDKAKKKDLYDLYICDMLADEPLDIGDDTYDVVTICGMSREILRTLSTKALDELTRIVKPGGYVVNANFRVLFEDDYASAEVFRRNMKILESQGKWRRIETRPFPGFLKGNDGVCCVHQVC